MKCSKCDIDKLELEFHSNGQKGRRKECKECRSEKGKVYYQRNSKRIRARVNGYYSQNIALFMLNSAQCRAKKQGVPFALGIQDIVIPTRCPVLGIELHVGSGKFSQNSPTLDRIKPDLGYVRGNARVISFRANLLKNNASAAELRLVADDAARLEARYEV